MTHAFMIMAHSDYSLLCRLIKKLDHKDNTIYLHIDAKSSFTDKDKQSIKSSSKNSNVIFTNRYDVTWGGYNQINTELRLLETAVKGNHNYYHYLSGVDFPIKSMADIHSFFEKYNGCEFIHFCSDEFTQKHKQRYSLYHFLQDKAGRNRKSPYFLIDRALLAVQKVLPIDRTKKYPDITPKSGGFWCSISNDCAKHILNSEPFINSYYSKSVCGDEHYIQTVVFNSNFKDNIYSLKYNVPDSHANLRYIEWKSADAKNSAPHTFDIDDYDSLMKSNNLFCRKVTDKTEKGELLLKKLELL